MAARSTPATCKVFLWTCAVFVARQATVAAQAPAGCGTVRLAVGSYSDVGFIKDPPASGEGVTLLDLELCDTAGTLSGTLTEVGVVPAGENPSYCDQLDATTIICANEIDAGTATTLGTDLPTTATTIDLGGVPKPTYINVLPDGVVATANFGGSFTTFKADTGVIQTVAADGGHPHFILETGGGEIVVPILKLDIVEQYAVAADGMMTQTGTTAVAAGSGPRHVALGPNGKVYIAAEGSLQIIELGPDCAEGAEGAARGVCGFVQLPAMWEGITWWTGAAIRVSKDNGFVYMSLREDGDGAMGAIAGVKLMPDGSLGPEATLWGSGGNTPRDFILAEVPGFKEVFIVANRKGNTVNVLDRDPTTGAVGAELAAAVVQTPTSILVLDGGAGAAAPAAATSAAPVAAPGAAPVAPPADGSPPATGTVAANAESAAVSPPSPESGARGVDPSALQASMASVTVATTFYAILAVIVALFIAM